MTELTGVISSTGLDEPSAAVSNECPRQLLGLACITGEYACLCELVDSSRLETTVNMGGQPALVNLTLNSKPGTGDLQAVMSAIDLTGYRANFDVSGRSVVVSFDLRRPENAPLRTLALDEHLREEEGR